MNHSTKPVVLSAPDQSRVEYLLSEAWGSPAHVGTVERIWGRDHVLRVHGDKGRSAVLKRLGSRGDDAFRRVSFAVEVASLKFLGAMPEPVSPKFLGADQEAGILLMEDLPAGGSLADSLLLGNAIQARADLVAYARALGSLHAWSHDRIGDYESLLQRYAPGTAWRTWWSYWAEQNRKALLSLVEELGVEPAAAGRELDEIAEILDKASFRGFVHGDPCPDNLRLVDGGCCFFDFERSSAGSVALDTAYLLAPFPSCWCFGSLPLEIAGACMDAYWEMMAAAGLRPDPDWDTALAAALACFLIARTEGLDRFMTEQRRWGTTLGRPRLRAWTSAASAAAEEADVFPNLRRVFAALQDRVAQLDPAGVVPHYPALAEVGSTLGEIPDWWKPGL